MFIVFVVVGVALLCFLMWEDDNISVQMDQYYETATYYYNKVSAQQIL